MPSRTPQLGGIAEADPTTLARQRSPGKWRMRQSPEMRASPNTNLSSSAISSGVQLETPWFTWADCRANKSHHDCGPQPQRGLHVGSAVRSRRARPLQRGRDRLARRVRRLPARVRASLVGMRSLVQVHQDGLGNDRLVLRNAVRGTVSDPQARRSDACDTDSCRRVVLGEEHEGCS